MLFCFCCKSTLHTSPVHSHHQVQAYSCISNVTCWHNMQKIACRGFAGWLVVLYLCLLFNRDRAFACVLAYSLHTCFTWTHMRGRFAPTHDTEHVISRCYNVSTMWKCLIQVSRGVCGSLDLHCETGLSLNPVTSLHTPKSTPEVVNTTPLCPATVVTSYSKEM